MLLKILLFFLLFGVLLQTQDLEKTLQQHQLLFQFNFRIFKKKIKREEKKSYFYYTFFGAVYMDLKYVLMLLEVFVVVVSIILLQLFD